MTELTARFALPLLQAGQAQKEIFHNEALTRIDASLHIAVATIATNAPPSVPVIGDSWIVGDTPDSIWSGRHGQIATWTPGGWRFVTPIAGMQVWLRDHKIWAWHDGAEWRSTATPTAGIAVNGTPVVGPQQPAISAPESGAIVDQEARSTISAMLMMLRNHGLIAT